MVDFAPLRDSEIDVNHGVPPALTESERGAEGLSLRTDRRVEDLTSASSVQREPDISVVVIAHDRRNYLLEAVRSVRTQLFDPRRFEVLVVKNYTDGSIDAELDRWGCQVILVRDDELGAKVAEGVRLARAPVVTFLEDDDRYDPRRLQQVAQQFSDDSGLAFYHNHIRVIDGEGRPVAAPQLWQWRTRWPAAGETVEEIRRADPNSVLDLVGFQPDSNLSSMAVRRRILLPWLDVLRRVPLAVDTFMFIAAVVSRETILLTSRPLTDYRVHGGNASNHSFRDMNEQLAARLRHARRNFIAHDLILKLALESHHAVGTAEANASRLMAEAFLRVLSFSSDRRGNFRLFIALVQARRTYYVRKQRPLLAATLTSAISPRLTRGIYVLGKRLGY